MALTRQVTLAVDCSALVKWELTDEDHAVEAAEMLRDWEAGAVILCSTDLLPSEIGSAFLRALRRGRLNEAEAQAGMQALLGMPFRLRPTALLVLRAFEIARRFDQRIYDCFYVALAEQEGAELWTGDQRLWNALSGHFPFVRFIADYVPLR